MPSLSRINMSFSYDDACGEHLSDAQETERGRERWKERGRRTYGYTVIKLRYAKTQHSLKSPMENLLVSCICIVAMEAESGGSLEKKRVTRELGVAGHTGDRRLPMPIEWKCIQYSNS